jgi:hypothetical protein
MDKKKNTKINKDDIKTYFDLKSWITRNCDLKDFDETLMTNIIDELCSQIKSSGVEGAGLFCFNLEKLKERINVN